MPTMLKATAVYLISSLGISALPHIHTRHATPANTATVLLRSALPVPFRVPVALAIIHKVSAYHVK